VTRVVLVTRKEGPGVPRPVRQHGVDLRPQQCGRDRRHWLSTGFAERADAGDGDLDGSAAGRAPRPIFPLLR
jgi:hypothetical protein